MKTTWQYCVAGISIALLLTSCVDPQQKKINRAVDALSKVEASTDDWGKIAVSELNLIENTGQFKLTYDLDVSNYVNSAQNSVNAAASTDLETGFYMGLAAQAAITPPVNVSIPGTGSNTLPSNPIPNNASTALNRACPQIANF